MEINRIIERRDCGQRVTRKQLKSGIPSGCQTACKIGRHVETADCIPEAIAPQKAAFVFRGNELPHHLRHFARARVKRRNLPYSKGAIPKDGEPSFDKLPDSFYRPWSYIDWKIRGQDLANQRVPRIGRNTVKSAFFERAEGAGPHNNEIIRQNNLNTFFRFTEEIFYQRQKSLIDRSRTDLSPFCFKKSERQCSADEQAVDLWPQMLKHRQLLRQVRPRNQPNNRTPGLIYHNIKYFQFSGKRESGHRRSNFSCDTYSRGHPT